MGVYSDVVLVAKRLDVERFDALLEKKPGGLALSTIGFDECGSRGDTVAMKVHYVKWYDHFPEVVAFDELYGSFFSEQGRPSFYYCVTEGEYVSRERVTGDPAELQLRAEARLAINVY